MFNVAGYEFLDCCGNIAHVGHCHPHVVHTGQKQLDTLTTAQVCGYSYSMMVEIKLDYHFLGVFISSNLL